MVIRLFDGSLVIAGGVGFVIILRLRVGGVSKCQVEMFEQGKIWGWSLELRGMPGLRSCLMEL